MVGGQDGIGSRLTYYSSLIEMPQFFACLLILAFLGLMIHVFFSWLSRKLAGWDA
jgi:NitT/TauT family transport system permease protein